jgi:hypothetical protein
VFLHQRQHGLVVVPSLRLRQRTTKSATATTSTTATTT